MPLKVLKLYLLKIVECLWLKKWVGHNNSKNKIENIKFKKLKNKSITKNSSL
jgi:hypothetical protein